MIFDNLFASKPKLARLYNNRHTDRTSCWHLHMAVLRGFRPFHSSLIEKKGFALVDILFFLIGFYLLRIDFLVWHAKAVTLIYYGAQYQTIR